MPQLCRAIQASREKLSQYYNKTSERSELFYNLKVMLNSLNRLKMYYVHTHYNTLL